MEQPNTVAAATTESERGRNRRQSRRYKAHDELNTAAIGDLVRIQECRPYSKEKRWRLLEILERAK
jgi:small subunit ribosomal protein S17